jgi:multiple sugar transport system substrate-binding protein
LQADMSRLHPFLVQAANDSNLWAGPDAAAAVEFFANLFDGGWAVEPLTVDSSWAGEAFGRGRVAMTIEGPWLVDYLAAEFPALQYEIVELPVGPAGPGTTAFVSCWVIGAQVHDVVTAMALAAELSAPGRADALASALGTLPPSVEQATAMLATRPRLGSFVAGLAYASPWTGPVGFTTQAEAANTALRMWLDDEATTADLLAHVAALGDPAAAP